MVVKTKEELGKKRQNPKACPGRSSRSTRNSWIQRDQDFATKKAERANLRVALRDKYRLPENAQDTATVEMAGDDIDVPEELAKMVDEDAEEEEVNDSFLKKLQNMDVDALKTKAQTTMTEMKHTAEEKCILM
ncbi:complexin-4c isoform X2 [Sphaeramia orbicularis]|uniref:complexin-4c isoform X2 n=1 Tax=Sphaeramia orbicularis TaxID=375764 RepID=UPI00117FCA77|nr:complexin-4-like isoform X2 [Sphaeramia orbicularis]